MEVWGCANIIKGFTRCEGVDLLFMRCKKLDVFVNFGLGFSF